MWCGKKKKKKIKEKEKVRKAGRYMSLEFLERVRIKDIDFFPFFFFFFLVKKWIYFERNTLHSVWAILEGECG